MALTDADRAEIEAKAAASLAAMNRSDFAGFTDAIHSPDAVIIPEGSPPVMGRNAIIEFLAGFPAFTNMNFEIREIDGDGDSAYVWGQYSFDLVDDGGDVIGNDVGSYIEIWRNGDNGWRCTRDIFNSDMAPE